jgi:hypothetical protein
MNRRKLPIGIQSFAKIRSGDYYYVDKTALALELIDGSSHYFLSRPRRFGKSLFSGLNHLTDISLDSRYSTLCGYTDKDIDTTFYTLGYPNREVYKSLQGLAAD